MLPLQSFTIGEDNDCTDGLAGKLWKATISGQVLLGWVAIAVGNDHN